MKLYATVTSERASKGQGGNRKLEISIKGKDREIELVHLVVFPENETAYKKPCIVYYKWSNAEHIVKQLPEPKGKKQKGESIAKEESEENRYRKA